MSEMAPNNRLAAIMQVGGFSKKGLARAVRDLSLRLERPVSCNHTSVSRWLAGMKPRESTARLIAAALGARLGRDVTLSEIGFAASDLRVRDLGTAYPATVDESVGISGGLLQADLDGVEALIEAPVSVKAWSEVPLSWLVRSEADSLWGRGVGNRIAQSDVLALRATTKVFADLDDRFGGGRARRSLIHYLNSEATPLLASRCTELVGRGLFAAVAEMLLLAAWMSYDSGIHGLAQRYFIQALRLADVAHESLLAGSVLAAMSHQATYLGRYRDGVNLARAARVGTGRDAPATLVSHFYAMEARALAAGGDHVGAQRVLGEAVRVFERRNPDCDPEWIRYFDDAELSAEIGHCFRDLGYGGSAISHAESALVEGVGASARSEFFVVLVMASGYLLRNEVEAACVVLGRALELGEQVRSVRCVEYLREARRKLQPFGHLSFVRQLSDEYAENPLWVASSSGG